MASNTSQLHVKLYDNSKKKSKREERHNSLDINENKKGYLLKTSSLTLGQERSEGGYTSYCHFAGRERKKKKTCVCASVYQTKERIKKVYVKRIE
jgi:hypothetical protein